MFALIVGARMKARSEHEVSIGWQVERFAREGKHMNSKTLDDYLKPPLSPEQQRELDAQKVRQAFERRIQKQKKKQEGG